MTSHDFKRAHEMAVQGRLESPQSRVRQAHVEPSMADVSDLAIPGAAGLGETRVADKVLSEIEAGKRGTGVVQGAVNGRP